MKNNGFTTHKVRVQEPGSIYYMYFDETKVETRKDFLVLRNRDGSAAGVWNKDNIVYCVPPDESGEYVTHKIRVRDPGTTYQMVCPQTKLETEGDFVVLRNVDGSPAGTWARDSVVYCVPHLEEKPGRKSRRKPF
jgi:hypothetical protein